MPRDFAQTAPRSATGSNSAERANLSRDFQPMARTLVLHVGLPKAASSYLHVDIFPQLMGGHYVMPGARNAKKKAYLFPRNRLGVRRFSDAFQKDPAFWAQHGDAFLRQYVDLASFDHAHPPALLISDEAVTRVNHYQIRAMPNAFDADSLYANLHGFCDSARRIGFERVRLLLMTRRQDTLLPASYVQLSRKIPRASQADFEYRVQRLLDRSPAEIESFFFGIDYGRLYDSFAGVVGPDNVSVMPIEMISPEFPEFVAEMRDLLDVESSEFDLSDAPVNARSREANRWGLRPLLLYKSRHGRIQLTVPSRLSGRSSEISLSPTLAEAIRAHFAAENRRVADATGRDFGQYGYY